MSGLPRPASAPERLLSDTPKKQRLDTLLVERGLAKTRSRARDLIQRGTVEVAGETVTKPGQTISADSELTVEEGASRYVSRGALKLIAALEAFGFDPSGCNALDIGASTGGFTQVLLERGADRVTCVDVGHGQLAEELRNNPRISNLEGLDARRLTAGHLMQPVTAITADVSFISLTKALPAALALGAPGCWLVALIKPQFEVGPDAVGKGGVVRDEAVRDAACEAVKIWVSQQPGWSVSGVIDSPVSGRHGNREYLLGAIKNE